LDGGHALSLHKDIDNDGNINDDSGGSAMQIIDDDDEGCVDASRIQQFLSRKQLYAAGICVAWLLQQAPKHPHLGLKSLLQELDAVLDHRGMIGVLKELHETQATNFPNLTKSWVHSVESVGYLERPRRFEIGQLLTRLHSIQMEEIPMEEDESDVAARLKEEQKKKALADLWAKRRSNTAQ
jgi:hypothetical protein